MKHKIGFSVKQNDKMLRDIRAEVKYTRRFIGKDMLDPRVMEAMRIVPRDEFVEQGMRPFAYDNGPLPIGYGQTISQPYIVALMTDLLEPKPNHIILEVGTGSGYQAAVLARLVKKVYTLEIIPELSERAATRLRRLGFSNVETRVADGYYGWRDFSPFDGIIVTAAAGHVPPELLEQLKPGGKLVIPVGQPHMAQILQLVEKDQQGRVKTRDVLSVAFVPLTGEH